MSDFDLGIEPDYESDFEEIEVAEPKKKATNNLNYVDDYEDESVHLDSPKNKHPPPAFKNLDEKKSLKAEKSSESEYDYENDYENEFEEESEEIQPKVAQNKIEKNWKPPDSPLNQYKNQKSIKELVKRGNSSNPRASQASENHNFSVSPLKMGALQNKNAKEFNNIPKSSAKNSARMSKNSTVENLRQKREVQVKKNKQMLEKENKKLREDLKALNEQLSHYLESATEEMKSKIKKPKKEADIRVNQEQVADKRLKIYQDEYKKIKEKYDRMTDTNYMLELKEEIKKKERLLTEFEKRNKFLDKDQKHRGKQIETFDDKQLADDKLKYSHLQEEYSKIDEQIKQITEQLEKEEEWYKVNQAKEIELVEKLEKFRPEEYQTQYVDKNLVNKYSKLKATLQNIEVNKSAVISQLKVQENSTKMQKENYVKELAELQEKIKAKSEEVKKIKYELDDTVMLASHHKMGKFVSLLNIRPQSEKGLSDSIENLETNKDQNSSKLIDEESNEKKISSQPKAKSEFDLSLKPNFLPDNKKDKKKAKKNDSDIIEDIPEVVEENKPGFLASLEDSPKKTKPNKEEPKKKSILDELEEESAKKPEVKPEPKKLSILEELEAEANNQGFKVNNINSKKPENPAKPSIFEELEADSKNSGMKSMNSLNKKHESQTKPSIFDELNAPSSNLGFKNPEPTKKSSILEELEEKPGFTEPANKRISAFRQPSREKQNFFLDSDKKQENLNFNPIKMPADEILGRKDSQNVNSRRKLGLFEELESKKEDNIWAKIENKDSNNLFSNENEKKNELFGNINLPDPSSKRNRGHLAKEVERKEDKIAALASNAANHDFFGGFLESNENKPIVNNFQSKLLPTKLDSQERKRDGLFKNNENDFKMPQFEGGLKPFTDSENKRSEPALEFKKIAPKFEAKKNFDLDEEDLLL